MKFNYKYRIFIGLALAICLFVGCGRKETTAPSKSDQIKIGLCFDSLVIERWQRDRDLFVSKAQELGASVNVQNANGNVSRQIQQIDYLISQNVDCIVIVACDTKSLASSVRKAHENGIHVIAYDRVIENANVDLYVSFDNKHVGGLMAQAIVNQFPKGADILAIMGSTSDQNVEQIEEGMNAVLQSSKSKIIHKEYASNWLAEKSFDAVSKFFESGKTCDAIICANDDLAAQAIRALSENQKAGKVYVVGQDGDLAACQRIVEGTQGGTVFKNVDELATQAATNAILLSKNQKLNVTDTFSVGNTNIKYLQLQPEFVTKENIDDIIINKGFHTKEEVYLNASKQ